MKKAVTINTVLTVFLILLITSAALIAFEMSELGPARVRLADMIITSLAGLVVLICLLKGTAKLKKSLLFIVYVFIAVEFTFQILAVLGFLPRINIFSHVPFGRVYWTKEGLGNSTMNRYGWHCPQFSPGGQKENIILIGDSMIQAVQVKPSRNAGAVLESLLNKDDPEIEVLSLGLSGIGPAQYLELLRYSTRYFNPKEVIIFFFLGNDFINSSYKVQNRYEPARSYIYYRFDEDGALRIHDESEEARADFNKELEYNHRSLFINAFRIVKSHCMTRAVLMSLAKGAAHKIDTKHAEDTENNVRNELRMLGLDDFIFKKELNDDALEAVRAAEGLLMLCNQLAASKGIELRIVTMPTFTPTFFDNYESADWSLEIGDYDFLLPERLLVDFARENGISILPLGKYMHDDGLEPESIKDLYFFGGSGHFSPKGHEYLAKAMYSSFYSK